jgi:hypothetical protein
MCEWGSPVVTVTGLETGLPSEQWLQYRLKLQRVQSPLLCAAGDLRLQVRVSHRSRSRWCLCQEITEPNSKTLAALTLSLLMSYICRAPCKARNFNVVYIYIYMDLRLATLKAVSFNLLHNVSTLN